MAISPLLRLFEPLKARGLLASLTSAMATRAEESRPSKGFRGLLESPKNERPAIRLSVPHGLARRMRQFKRSSARNGAANSADEPTRRADDGNLADCQGGRVSATTAATWEQEGNSKARSPCKTMVRDARKR